MGEAAPQYDILYSILPLTLRWTHYDPHLTAGQMVALWGSGWSQQALLASAILPCARGEGGTENLMGGISVLILC